MGVVVLRSKWSALLDLDRTRHSLSCGHRRAKAGRDDERDGEPLRGGRSTMPPTMR
jgi:hypothetical protein